MNLAILGAGSIAGTMADTVNQMEKVKLYAVASRDFTRAEAFAKQYHVEKAYGSYEEMLSDKNVDLVYIATPNALHCEQIKLCADYKKAVLCEKAFALNANEAKDALAYAKEKGVFVAEAMWVRYMPMTKILKDIIAAGRIGKITGLSANIGNAVMEMKRIHSPKLGGGALLDLGVYALNFATTVLGDDVEKISSLVTMHETGVDAQEFVNLAYENGVAAGLFSTVLANTDRRGVVYGTDGYISVDNINNYEAIHIYDSQRELVETIERPEQVSGYEYQILACMKALENGELECEEMPHTHTIRIMEIIDEVRKLW